MKGYKFLYEINPEKIQQNREKIRNELKDITLRQFNKFHSRHQFRLFRMYKYLKEVKNEKI